MCLLRTEWHSSLGQLRHGTSDGKGFRRSGAAVVLADFREEAVRAEAQRLVAAGHKAIAIRCDVSDEAQVATMVDRTVAEFGRLDAALIMPA